MTTATKHDADKLRYDLLPAAGVAELVRTMTYGARKYGERNWEAGFNYGRPFAALMRHAFAWLSGETLDPETRLHHLAHAAFNCLILVEFHFNGRGVDDRSMANMDGFGMSKLMPSIPDIDE